MPGFDTGDTTPGNIVNNSGGLVSWTNPSDAGALDSTAASAVLVNTQYTDGLLCTAFGFSLPSDTTSVDGFVVHIVRRASTAAWIQDYSLSIWSSGAAVGSSQHDGSTTWGTSYATKTYGGSANLWSVAPPSYSTINASGFGVRFQCTNLSMMDTITVEVDSIDMCVYYTAPGGSGIQRRLAQIGNRTASRQVWGA